MTSSQENAFCPHCGGDISTQIAKEMEKINHPHQWYGGRTYAQHGDDMMLINIFKRLKIETPSYLDVGAHHPFVISNTALLYARGSRGINVEANPNLIQAFIQYRPEDINVNIGVAPQKGTMRFYYDTETSGRNSFIKDRVEELGIIDEKELPVTTLWDIVETYAGGKFPDILSLDVEGMDYEILKTIPFEISRPKVICVEIITREVGDKNEIKDLLIEKGYFSYCWTGCNLFFIHNDYRASF